MTLSDLTQLLHEAGYGDAAALAADLTPARPDQADEHRAGPSCPCGPRIQWLGRSE